MAAELKAFLADKAKFEQFCKSAFDGVDTDKSGQIDEKELGAAMNYFAKELSIPAPKPDEIKGVLQALDTDKSGKIDFKEFGTFVYKLLSAIAEHL